jgi:hypothetical protein
MNILNTIKDYLAGLLEREAARLIALAGSAATAAILFAAAQAGITLDENAPIVLAIVGLAVVVVEEAIRKAVYSLKTHKEEVAKAAATGIDPSA